ncbi:MAG: hypothetical protein ACFFEV_09385 [Candidatus Thorarchaeota archaeon]
MEETEHRSVLDIVVVIMVGAALGVTAMILAGLTNIGIVVLLILLGINFTTSVFIGMGTGVVSIVILILILNRIRKW